MKRLNIMASLFSLLAGFFVQSSDAAEYKVAEAYTGLRNMVLSTKPTELGLNPSPDEVWGVLMETGYPTAVVTLVALGDGTVSLYFSNGGGIIGLGPSPGPQRAAKDLIASAQKFVRQGQPTNGYPLPSQAMTRFYLLTGGRTVMFEGKENDMGNNRLPVSPLFHKAQELISQIRMVDEKRRAEQSAPTERVASKPAVRP